MNCWGERAFATAPAGRSGIADELSVAVPVAAAARATGSALQLGPPAGARAARSSRERPEAASPESSVIPSDQVRGDARSQCGLYPTQCLCLACAEASAAL